MNPCGIEAVTIGQREPHLSAEIGAMFSAEERSRVISDIAHWKCELEWDNNFTGDDLESYIAALQACDDAELRSWWDGTVGEWVASRHDITVPPSNIFEAWLDTQFMQVMRGNQTEYGYVVSIDIDRLLTN